MEYRIESGVDPAFVHSYETYMLQTCGKDELPNPHGAKHGIFHNYRPWEYDKVYRQADFSTSDVVLDAGALHTYFCIYVAQFVKQIYAVDSFYWAGRDYMQREKLFSPEQWMQYVAKKTAGKIRCENADLMSLQYSDGLFDKILCVSTIEHVKDDLKALKEMARVLKKGGRLLLTTEFNRYIGKGYSEADRSYTRVYNARRLRKLIAGSRLKLADHAIVEKRNFLCLRTHVNVFVSLEK